MRRLTKRYPGATRPALKDVDLSVKRGERVAVLGLSGAGKSTLIRCMNRLVEPTSGELIWYGHRRDDAIGRAVVDHVVNDVRGDVRGYYGHAVRNDVEDFDVGDGGNAVGNAVTDDRGQFVRSDVAGSGEGIDVLSLRGGELRAYRRRIGMIFQEFHLGDRLSVLANVLTGRFGYVGPWQAVFGRYTEDDVDDAAEALARVGLTGFERRRARQLSGGQRQRVAIARALVQQPLLLLGDEPVSNLDPMTARGVMHLLTEINERDGLTMIVNLHSVELAVGFAQRIIGMNDGRIVFDDEPGKLDDAALHAIYAPTTATVLR